jgi:tellurite resistance protein
MVMARSGNIRREFRAVIGVLERLRGYDEKSALELVQRALDLETDVERLAALCKQELTDGEIREAIGLMAYLARIDGDVSAEEEAMFTRLCQGLGVVINGGAVEISR